MKPYDGTTDPEEHIAQYRERMEIIPVPTHLNEACLRKGFGSTLIGSALKWLLSVTPCWALIIGLGFLKQIVNYWIYIVLGLLV